MPKHTAAALHFLNLLILVSGLGLFVDRMACNRTGREYWAINTSLEGCSDDCSPVAKSVSDDCCNREVEFIKEITVTDEFGARAVLAVMPVLAILVTHFQPRFSAAVSYQGALAKAPPRVCGRPVLFRSLLI